MLMDEHISEERNSHCPVEPKVDDNSGTPRMEATMVLTLDKDTLGTLGCAN
jgi:hypothetical protein